MLGRGIHFIVMLDGSTIITYYKTCFHLFKGIMDLDLYSKNEKNMLSIMTLSIFKSSNINNMQNDATYTYKDNRHVKLCPQFFLK